MPTGARMYGLRRPAIRSAVRLLSKGMPMKISSRGTYGILALEELARRWDAKTPIQVKEIAERKGIPVEFLGQIMISLKQADICRANRGPGGGYYLTRPPDQILLREVLEVLSGPVTGPEESLRKYTADSVAARKVLETWRQATAAMEEVIDGVTLADVCEPDERPHMYYI